MRRLDDGHVARPPPFRVLAAPDASYLSPLTAAPPPPPPPPRAPEPYKVAPSSTAFSRAHRRSSFVIIAESRPATPETRSPSPTLAGGRVSPFRGRGFKGPPPRSRSRPQSPEPDARRRVRNERRVSVSQQSSPRRSLIPQPTRQRSTSLTKTNDRPSSPKIGRRVDSRNRLNVSDSRNRPNASDSRNRLNVSDSRNRFNASSNGNGIANLATRRQFSKSTTRLSPIQGTPTKPDKSTPKLGQRGARDATRPSPSKISRFTSSPSKNIANPRRSNQEKNTAVDKSSSRERLMSPSRIPLKTVKNGTNSINPARFITIANQPTEKGGRKGADKGSNETGSHSEPMNGSSQSGKQSEESSKDSEASDKKSLSNGKKGSELDLLGLLKRSSTATGTSSVVNTTTTTAVQPLHIDATASSAEKDVPEKSKARIQGGGASSSGKSSNSVAPSEVQNGSNFAEEQRTSEPQVSSKSSKSGGNYARSRIPGDSRNNSPVPTENIVGESRSNGVSQSAKNFNRTNVTANGTGSATQRSNRNQTTAVIDVNSKSVKSNGPKLPEVPSVVQSGAATNLPRSNEIDNESNDGSINATAEARKAETSGSATIKSADPQAVSRTPNDAGTRASSTTTTDGSVANQVTTTTTIAETRSVPVNATVGAVTDSQNVNSAIVRVRNDNRGSNASLKSSAGMSVESIESARSTDTGVSVNTVRGVSSPREKTGMHVVKRPQEIETLSGNVMHLEQNGEPAVLAAANGVGERVPERLLTRWKRSLSRYCECCSSMRCLACRTDPKGLFWARNHGRNVATNVGNEIAPEVARNAAGEGAPAGCWSKLKNRCRCNRLREIKCCARRSRIAPAEATVCCPPERRFGAICRRLFDRCKCKRAEAERTRSIRAKHSLTSVAPPPLSEEPKSKIPDVLVEHNSLMRGAIPCLPVPLAWFCLVWNILLPGSGTVWSGLFNLCTGQPRFSAVAGLKSRLGALVVNLIVGVGQLFTVLFCLVGWGWSIWWGVMLVRLARKYKRFKASEAANNDPEARGGESTPLPPGVPGQALRGIERAR